MRISRVIHPTARFRVAKLSELAPDARASGVEGDADPTVIGFQDEDGETHIYVLSDDARKKLASDLTGGVIVERSLRSIETMGRKLQ